jgi:transglutaminase-like putative cysteine protease
MKIIIRHETVWRSETPVRYSIQYLRLTPRRDAGQRILEWRIDTPGRQWLQTDAYGNVIVVMSLDQRHDELGIVARGVVETSLVPKSPLPNESPLPPEAFLVPTGLTQAAEEVRAIGARARAVAGDRENALSAITTMLRERVVAQVSEGGACEASEDVLVRGTGTAEEVSHLFLACARAAGLPARYVSGYLASDSDRVTPHAWADVWIAGRGWISVDPTHGTYPGQSYLRLAVGRDALDAAPVRDARQGGGERITTITTGSAGGRDSPVSLDQ